MISNGYKQVSEYAQLQDDVQVQVCDSFLYQTFKELMGAPNGPYLHINLFVPPEVNILQREIL